MSRQNHDHPSATARCASAGTHNPLPKLDLGGRSNGRDVSILQRDRDVADRSWRPRGSAVVAVVQPLVPSGVESGPGSNGFGREGGAPTDPRSRPGSADDAPPTMPPLELPLLQRF